MSENESKEVRKKERQRWRKKVVRGKRQLLQADPNDCYDNNGE